MGAVEISIIGLLFGFLLLAIPLIISNWFKLGMGKTTLWSIGRMSVQLMLVGFFLEYIFALNNPWLNFAWLILMIITAIFSAISRA